MIPMWIYVIVNSEIPNILTESLILQDFRIKISQPELDYILVSFQSAIEYMKKEGGSIATKFSNLAPIYIQTKTIIPELSDSGARSQSMQIGTKHQFKEDTPNILNSVTSSLKGFFNK
jgi:hypothetical protein